MVRKSQAWWSPILDADPELWEQVLKCLELCRKIRMPSKNPPDLDDPEVIATYVKACLDRRVDAGDIRTNFTAPHNCEYFPRPTEFAACFSNTKPTMREPVQIAQNGQIVLSQRHLVKPGQTWVPANMCEKEARQALGLKALPEPSARPMPNVPGFSIVSKHGGNPND